MKYYNAKGTNRFVAYLIDWFIITIVANPIIEMMYPVFNFDPDLFLSKSQFYLEQFMAGNIDIELAFQIITMAVLQFVTQIVVMIPIIIIYFCIIPLFWDKQTIGRFALSVKVVNAKDESKCSFSRLFLREVIGFYIVTELICGSMFIPLIILIYVACKNGRSFADYIGGTRLISLKNPFPVVPQNNDVIEGEVNNSYSNDSSSSSSDDYTII